jgi:hypothetical protein
MIKKQTQAIVVGKMSQSGVIIVSRAVVSKAYAGRLDENYELANTRQLKPIFNLSRPAAIRLDPNVNLWAISNCQQSVAPYN